jgi:hypothetical protein
MAPRLREWLKSKRFVSAAVRCLGGVVLGEIGQVRSFAAIP